MSNNSSVAHSFAYGNEDSGSNFYSNGDTIYSYSSLLARRFSNGIVLISEHIANYSNTSQRHHSHLSSAIKHMEYYYVSDLDRYGKFEEFFDIRELEVVNKELIELYMKQKRARKRDYSWEIKNQLDKGKAILKYGKVDKRSGIYKQFMSIQNSNDLDTILANAEEAKKLEQKRVAKQRFDINKVRFQKFTGVKCPYKAGELEEFNYLRVNEPDGINPKMIQTNGGVRVYFDEAKILYKAYKSGKNIVGKKIDYYTILKVNSKEVQIGCHHILAKELDRVLGE